MVGKHAVLLKNFNAEIQPLQVKFDRLADLSRIMALPPRLMKAEFGLEFAKPIGTMSHVESDDDCRCW